MKLIRQARKKAIKIKQADCRNKNELHGQIEDIISADSYTMGFRDGAKLMIDILLGSNENLISK